MRNVISHKTIAIPQEQTEGKPFFYPKSYIVELLQDVEELVTSNPITHKKTTAPAETIAMIKQFFAEEGWKIRQIGGLIDSLNQRDWGRHIPTLTDIPQIFGELDRPITPEKWVQNHYGFKFATLDKVVANAKYVLGLNAAMQIPFPPHSTVNRTRIFTEIFPDLDEFEYKYKRLRLDSSVAPNSHDDQLAVEN